MIDKSSGCPASFLPYLFLKCCCNLLQTKCVRVLCVLVWNTNRDNAYDSAEWDLTAESWSFKLCGRLIMCCNHQLAAAAAATAAATATVN